MLHVLDFAHDCRASFTAGDAGKRTVGKRGRSSAGQRGGGAEGGSHQVRDVREFRGPGFELCRVGSVLPDQKLRMFGNLVKIEEVLF